MKVIVEKADGTPVSTQDAEILLKYLKDRFSQSPGEKQEHTGNFPDTDFDIEILIEEDSANVYALAICPGIKKDQIEITVDEGRLSISTKDAVKGEASGNKPEKHHFQGYIDQLKYYGECELPTEIIPEDAEADLKDGILYLTMPKPDTAKPKMIIVK